MRKVKPLIIAIVGSSGSGKTTAANLMNGWFGIKNLVSFTTRPMRDGEVNGEDHWFVEEKDMPPRCEMLAYTEFGGYHYWTELSQLENDTQHLYVIDEKGLQDMMDRHGSHFILCSIYIFSRKKWVSDENRVKRDKERKLFHSSFYDYVVDNSYGKEQLQISLYNIADEINYEYYKLWKRS